MLEYQILFDGHMLLMISMARKLLEYFMKKNWKKINKDLGQKKSLKENNINYMSNEKDMIIHLIAGLIKKLNWMKLSCTKMSQYFSKPYEPFGGDINV